MHVVKLILGVCPPHPTEGFVAHCHIISLQGSMGYAHANIKHLSSISDLIKYNLHINILPLIQNLQFENGKAFHEYT
jgi:hypothetical protein